MVILSFGGGAEGEHICNGLTVAETGIVSIHKRLNLMNIMCGDTACYL